MKNKKRSRNNNNNQGWSASDHALREEKRGARMAFDVKAEQNAQRTAQLTHDTVEKRSSIKVKLHLTKVKREISQMKERLSAWDAQEEAEEEARALRVARADEPPKKKGRKGPETWKLKGAARPAWEVYNFDTRYIDPHVEAHKNAKEKVKRSVNLLVVHKGNFAGPGAPSICRDFLGLLMQWGHLSVEARQFKTARSAWLECMELEGDAHVVTTAREDLMRLYLSVNKLEDAFRLGMQLKADKSAYIRYSTAWAAVELNQDEGEQESAMVAAIKGNPFCSYYLAFFETFSKVMEYTDEIEQSDDCPQSSLEEALEYCQSEAVNSWQQNGASVLLRKLLLGAYEKRGPLSLQDVEWKEKLSKLEAQYDSRSKGGAFGDVSDSTETPSSEAEDVADESSQVDILMFIGMFRTAMEMVSESGDLP